MSLGAALSANGAAPPAATPRNTPDGERRHLTIGKSRLMEEFQARIKAATHLWIECAGAPFFVNTPFHAVTRMLDQGLSWRGDESSEVFGSHRQRLAAGREWSAGDSGR